MIAINIEGNGNKIVLGTGDQLQSRQVDPARWVAWVDDQLSIVRCVDCGRGLRAYDERIHRFVKSDAVDAIRPAYVDETCDTIALDEELQLVNDEVEYADAVSDTEQEIDMLRSIVDGRGREIEELKSQISALTEMVAGLVNAKMPMRYVAIDTM